MENIAIKFDAKRFDECCHGGLPEGGDLEFVVKDGATVDDRPAVCITWSTQLPDGTIRRVQSVTTLRLLIGALRTLEAHKPERSN